MKSQITFFLLLVIPLISLAQKDEDYSQIKKAVNNYFIGWESRNTDLLNEIFHEEATLKYLDRNKAYAVVAIQQHIEDITATDAKFLPPHVRAVNSIDIFKEGASAIVHLRFKTFEVTDFFQLLKIGGDWKIINKMSVSGSLPEEVSSKN